MKKASAKTNKILALLLYLLPIIFFLVSYFLITTSGEDIFQGAGNFRTNPDLVNPLSDMSAAFNYNSRLTDMYAWSVIDFYDYQFSFGIDTIFRLVDTLVISLVLLIALAIVLDRKPKLIIKDALIFCGIFVLITLPPFGRPLYTEFSMIHNYGILALVMLAFSLPYIRLLLNKTPNSKSILYSLLLLILGIIFGMSSVITPLAFIAAVAIYCFIKRKTIRRPPLWFFAGLLGVIIGTAICWLAGTGVDHYTSAGTSAAFDYVALSDIFTNFSTAVPKIIIHIIYNFSTVLISLFAILLVLLSFTKNLRKFFTRKFFNKISTQNRKLILAFSIFIIIHLLGTSQIMSPPRLLMPAYFAGVILLLKLFANSLNSKPLAIITIITTLAVVIIHTSFLSIYHHDMAKVLSEIKNSPAADVCVERSRIATPYLKFVNLSQSEMLVDWGMPQQIYNKNVTFCGE